MTKLVTVFGATGQQGSSVVRELLKNGNFKVRALTRDPSSEASKSLKELGAEVVKSNDTDSKEAIQEVLKGSDAVFALTIAFAQNETDVGKKIADAAFGAGVKHFVFSGLPPCNKISNGRIIVPHFDQKYLVEEYVRELSESNPSFISSFVYAPFYYQNFKSFVPKKNENGDGGYTISLPSNGKPMDMGDVDNIGAIVCEILLNENKYSGVVVPFSGGALSGPEIANIFSKVSGKSVTFKFIPPSIFRTFGFPNANDLASMFEFYNEFGVFNDLDQSIASKITKFTTFGEYLKNSNFKLD
ncbi:NmrA-like protein [Dictyostelium discoideum AX4]|uniref:NmrA-like protein n=1 Tax=Dictyostelium discoideum TaxID=44689 RepID=Q86IG4_DICDI|nr:NmrA-like protein [Dictyostelium discoideum AX4]EAL70981.1 NmrA-like protein [Dictyostelium discoideum AX4]|eukprot:XP_644900.1 NmrA-like protein [Dictyostelium discoideum AX4]